MGVPLRTELAIYGVGFFPVCTYFMTITIMPLWVLQMDLSPLLLGIVLGCRPVLPLLFSIHTGAMIDRIGGRKVMIFFALILLVTPALYPAMPWVWAVIALQMTAGFADSMGWLGAQAMVGQLMQGRTIHTVRLALVSRAGNVIGPILAGAAWDIWGPWGTFGMISLWASGMLVSALMLPKGAPGTPAPRDPTPSDGEGPRDTRPTLRMLVPNPADYITTFKMLATPALAITVMLGMMTHVGNNIQSTFYIVWLNGMGISGTLIGSLFSISAMVAGAGTLLAGPLGRVIPRYWLLWLVVATSIILIAITPLLGSYMVLMVVLSIRSGFGGMHQPLVISLMLRNAGKGSAGKVMGLRGTANRVASIVGPISMGAIAEVIGIEASFYVIGAIATGLMILIAWRMTLHPEIHEKAREG
ncbi:MAG: MFS transporter [Alphaproteobacteria bacterium]